MGNNPIYTEVATLKAIDIDADSGPVHFYIEKIIYYRPRSDLKEIIDDNVFIIDQITGILQTNETFARFTDGCFNITVKAQNAPDKQDFTLLKVFVLQDTELMRFVFDRDPNTVQKTLPEFKLALESTALPNHAQKLKFNIYETEFYSKVDGSIDFGKTSSCFQIMEDERIVDLKTSETIFAENDIELKRLFEQFNVQVERCSEVFVTKKIQWVEISLIAIAATIAVCCFYSKYKRQLRK